MNAVKLCLIILCLATPCAVRALGPHELVIVVNKESESSRTIAQDYAELRGVPRQNIIYISLAGDDTPSDTMTREQFTESIWKPVTRTIRDRHLEHALAWAYSDGFPIRIETGQHDCSLLGLTFTRNRDPAPEEIRGGTCRSSLFAGPNMPGQSALQSQSFDRLAALHGPDMPLPSMILGATGPRANTIDEISLYLANGVRSDHTAPSGTIFFVTSDDVRSTARAWQFAQARDDLAALGVRSEITPDFPEGRGDVLGIMMGTERLQHVDRNAYLPGCLSDHLTSWAGAFDHAGQSKISEWLRAGMAGSAGTVVEPYAIWMKFPNAWLYVHYASGCTAIESYYQSISCPLQMLIIGDPLAQPWAPRAKVILGNVVAADDARGYEVQAIVQSSHKGSYRRFMFLVDGRAVTGIERRSVLTFQTAKMKNGSHTLRAVAYRTGPVRSQAFDERTFEVRNGRIVE